MALAKVDAQPVKQHGRRLILNALGDRLLAERL